MIMREILLEWLTVYMLVLVALILTSICFFFVKESLKK